MNQTTPFPKEIRRLMVRVAETPRRFLMFNSVGHLTAAFLFNFLKIKHYGLS